MDINEKDETKDREGKFIQNIHKVKFNIITIIDLCF